LQYVEGLGVGTPQENEWLRSSVRSAAVRPRVWEVLRKFKQRCSRRGWKAAEDGDWVKVGETYHAFLWCRSLSPGTLRSIVTASEISICEESLWKVKKVDYIAFLTESFANNVFDVFEPHPEFLNRVVLYDIDHGLKMGKATSPVFGEFERFIEEEYGIGLKPVTTVQSHEVTE
jgi:hypothetical protein